MPTTIGALGASPQMTGANQADSAMSALSGMGSDGFLKLLVAQLRYQSPLEPSDPGDMMLQTAQLAQLDATQQMASLQRRDLGLQQAVMAAGLVGNDVTATAGDGTRVQGVVDAVRYTTAGPVLDVGGREVPLDQVTEIRRATDA
jgi:flagellar basal-body rod modification protein FlgD